MKNKKIKMVLGVFLCSLIFSDMLFVSGHASQSSSDEDTSMSRASKRQRAVAFSAEAESVAAPVTGGAAGGSAAPVSASDYDHVHPYAIATTDTAFKQMLSFSTEEEQRVVISFLNTFIPAFRGNPVVSVHKAPEAIPALRRPGEKQTFMDLYVIDGRGHHYIIEMQAQRHIMFDERALFYACSTYAHQLPERTLSKEDWYKELNPVIALQILDYDSNRVRGIKDTVPDTLSDRVKIHPLPSGKFTKHYVLQDKESGQEIDYLQMIQVELPRAEEAEVLFPPRDDFTPIQWWISLLKHANEYTDTMIEDYYSRQKMPEEIYRALGRLHYPTWSPEMQREYREDITNRELYATVLAVEREEGRAEGKREMILGMFNHGVSIEQIASIASLAVEQVRELLSDHTSTSSHKK